MSHDPRRPVGKGQEVHVTTDGHYVKSLICDPLAKHFIRAGVLNDYSVGISEPDFRYRDSQARPAGQGAAGHHRPPGWPEPHRRDLDLRPGFQFQLQLPDREERGRVQRADGRR